MMRLLGALLGLLLLAAIAAAGAAAWLLATDSGARWLAGQVNQRVAGVELTGVSGNLLSGLRVDRFVYLGVVHARLREVELEAALWPLLELQAMDVHRFRAAAVELSLPAADADEQAQAPLLLAQLALPSPPLPLRVRAAQIKLLRFEGIALEELAIAGAWREEGLFIDELRVRQGEVSLDARGTLGARAPLQLDVALTWFYADMSGRAGVTGPLSQPRITHRWTNPWVTAVTSQGRLNLEGWPRVGADLNHSIDDPRVQLNTVLEGADRDWQILADGRVMDYPVQGQIRAGLHEVITLDVEQGQFADQVRVALQLAYGQTLEVDAQLASDELAALLADVAGDARVRLNYRDGRIELAAQSRRLLAGGAEFTDTRIEATGPVQWREGRIDVTARSQRLRVADAEAAEVNISLQGPVENLTFSARWAQGHFSGSLRPLGERIEVAVDAGAEINAEGYAFTNLEAFTVAGRDMLWTATPHCWSGLGQVCIEESELAADVAAASGRISGLQLAAFNSLLPVAFDSETRLSGDWRWRSQAGEWRATTQLETEGLDFAALERQFDWLPDVTLSAEVGPSGLVLNASGAEPGLNWQATLDADGWTAAANIEGHAQVDLDAAKLPTLVDALQRFEGEVSAKVDLSGTLGAPQAVAEGTWRQGTFDWRDPALILTEIDMEWRADPSGWSIQGRAVSERGGALTLRGSGDGYDTAATMQGNVASEGLTLRSDLWTVSAVPEARVVVEDGRVRFDGAAKVPSARVVIKSLPTALPKPVADVRVKGRPEMVVDDALPIRGRLKISLGDDVRLELLALAVRLTGDVVAEVEGTEVAALHGELLVADGSLNASGQSLKVKDGRILFSGDPELPYVDLIATRDIRDQSPPLEVGLRISGRADALKTSLYSVPAMNETRQLSFLVLGRDFNESSDADSNQLLSAAISLGLSQSRGVVEQLRGALGLDELAALAAEQNDVAIVAGKRITDDLYVRYSYNALSAVSALIIRYHLTDRWRLEATNDVNSSMDFLYEFSR